MIPTPSSTGPPPVAWRTTGLKPLPWCITHKGLWLNPGKGSDGLFQDGWCNVIDSYEWHLREDCVREDPPKHWVDA